MFTFLSSSDDDDDDARVVNDREILRLVCLDFCDLLKNNVARRRRVSIRIQSFDRRRRHRLCFETTLVVVISLLLLFSYKTLYMTMVRKFEQREEKSDQRANVLHIILRKKATVQTKKLFLAVSSS